MDNLTVGNTDVAVLDISTNASFTSFVEATKELAKKYGERKIMFSWTTDDKKIVIILEPKEPFTKL